MTDLKVTFVKRTVASSEVEMWSRWERIKAILQANREYLLTPPEPSLTIELPIQKGEGND